MKNILFVMIALFALVASSCQKTEVYNDELTTSVVFKPVMEEDLTINKSNVNRDVLGNDFVNVAIESMTLSAKLINSTYEVSNIFNIVETGGDDVIRLNDVALGTNIFRATTTSYVEIPATDPFATESDGFSSYNQSFPTSNSIKTTEATVEALRAIRPFVEFIGETEQLVTYNSECESDCNDVILNMEAQQGRWIATVEFASSNIAANYEAKVKVTHNGGPMGPAPARTVSISEGNPFAWFYMTHQQCDENLFITMVIELKDKYSGNIVRTWTLDTNTHEDEIAVENGVDRWVKIVISEDALKSGCVDFTFNWEWSDEDIDIDLGGNN